MRPEFFISLSLLLLFFTGCTENRISELDLAGTWQYRPDPEGTGESEGWATGNYEGKLQLPGTLEDNDIGTVLDLKPEMNRHVLTGLHQKHSYIGKAWYQREIEIPEYWEGQHIELKLERVLWESTVWIDGKKVDSRNSLIAPHRYDLSDDLSPGKHRIAIRIDNGDKLPGINVHSDTYPEKEMQSLAHAYTNHTQVKWNGILGDMVLKASDPVRIESLQVYPDPEQSEIRIRGRISGGENFSGTLEYGLTDPSGKEVPVTGKKAFGEVAGGAAFDLTIPVADPELWNEFTPLLYTLDVSLNDTGRVLDRKEQKFGFSRISRKDGVLMLNGQRIFLRGNLECAIFPLTGYPPTGEQEWKELIATAKSYGLNHLRFHSYCPPSAAFKAADEAGFYLQVELPLWSLKVGEDKETNDFLKAEADRLLEEYGNHPSFVLMSLGNELQGDARWMTDFVEHLKQKDNRHLYTATTFSFQEDFGAMPRPHDDYLVTQWTDDGWVRGQKIFNDESPAFNRDFSENIRNVGVPVISHEIGQYTVFPDFSEIDRYTGNLEPVNFTAIREDMERKGLLPLAEDYLQATGKFAAILYKEEIERALKTRGFDGFQLLQLQDFPGQGTAIVGLLNAFWESKGVITPEEFRRFNSELVPLARFEKAVYGNDEKFVATVEIANFYKELQDQDIQLTLKDGKKVVARQDFKAAHLPVDNVIGIGEFSCDLSQIGEAKQLELEISLAGTPYRNHWNIWVYPRELDMETGATVFTGSYDEAEKALKEGKNVLLNPDLRHIKGVDGKFLPVFWSPVHFPNQPGTMGVLVDPDHKAFEYFPTGFHSDWQWWDPSVNARSVRFDSLQVRPLVRMIDNFYKNRNMATVFECRVGKGKLIFSSIDLRNKLEHRPVARQLKYSLLKYMASGGFDPDTEMDYDRFRKFIFSDRELETREYDIYE
ncbi:glycoside hydrolase family 2 protein [Sinomicrobium soli]|uniref:glycoside hydrolase family 2 protein n=1 Tax=Sinomicrobium sp. N-1-3-6 TaxID=2219864 RepID=UPI000DCB2658|nr:sugar-binding domain-containing protein [Sinomicrobium sp. N-1-3-6]RAV30012.1 glycoside hydrolase family 2 [Sinomicrobium sp. N-1-3-6]